MMISFIFTVPSANFWRFRRSIVILCRSFPLMISLYPRS
jgi:hypothetical protein